MENTNENFRVEIPYDVIELPSKGQLYENNINTLEIEYLTAMDESILTSPNLIANGKFMDILLDRKIRNKKINPLDLIIGDRNAILIFLRTTSYGEMYPISLIDPKTGNQFETEIDLSMLKIKGLGAKPDDNMEFDFKLPKSGKSIKFRLLTGRDENEIEIQDERFMSQSNSEISNKPLYRLYRQITEIDGSRDSNRLLKEIQLLPLADIVSFKKYYYEISPGIDLEIDVETPRGESFKTFLPINSRFFWPDI